MKKILRLFYRLSNYLKLRNSGVIFTSGVMSFTAYNRLFINISKKSKVRIGENVSIISGGEYNPLSSNLQSAIYVMDNATLIIGDNVGISSSQLWCAESIEIGSNVKIGANCVVLDNDCHSIDFRDRRNKSKDAINIQSKPIVIEDDVLVGTRSIILKGVRIGARSIIGSGSIVTKDIPSDSIAGGNPCRVIKKIDYKR